MTSIEIFGKKLDITCKVLRTILSLSFYSVDFSSIIGGLFSKNNFLGFVSYLIFEIKSNSAQIVKKSLDYLSAINER